MENELLKTIFDSALDGIFIIDLSGRYVDVNPAGCAMFGYSKEELLAGDIRLLLFPEDVERAFERGKKSWREGAFVPESRMRRKDGSEVWVEITVKPLKTKMGDLVLGIKRDITERKRAVEEEKRKTTETLKGIIDNTSSIIFLKDGEGRFILVNRSYEKIFNLAREAVINKTDYDVFPKESADAFRENDRKVCEASSPIAFEEAVLHADGTLHTYVVVKFTIPSIPGSVCGIATDITARKEAEEGLKFSEERLKEAQAIARIGNWDWDIAGDKLYWSDEIYRIFGIGQKEFGAAYEAFLGSVHPDDRELVKASVNEALAGKKPYDIDHRIVLPGGAERLVHEKATVFFGKDGRPVRMAGTVQDITERDMVEREILKARKLESIGVLAGGIAHDFNNLLLGILGNVSVAKALADPAGKVHSLLSEIEKAALKSKDLTKQLLTFSKGGEPVREMVNLAQLVEDSARLALREAKVQCSFSFQKGLYEAEADSGQLSQVINNIVLNAAQAMGDFGRIDVKAENVTVGEGGPLPKAGDYVKISVRDFGPGIPKKIIGRVFDPFFTTKDKASGLGLAVSYSIMKKHGGLITAESSNDGAAFSVYIPAAVQKTETGTATDDIAMGSGRILVMDDEVLVRDVTREMLELLGYESSFAEDGTKAVELYKDALRSGSPFEAVILDLTVPHGMGGLDTLKELLKADPSVKAIVSSGYSKDPIMSDYPKYGFSGVIVKPYRVSEFSRAIKAVLEKGR
ncbi:MAG: PAS domain S-box protein [Deltaproteobacteria bacterium]|nr:PAS domain S-box protein [Deltaproteobacteria bacterium]